MGVGVPAEGLGVGEGLVLLGIGVEVVVHVDAVDVVAVEQVFGDAEGVVAGLGLARVEPEVGAVRAHEVGALVGDVQRRVASDALGVPDAEGVDPGVDIEARVVGGLEPDLERVVGRDGRLPLPPGQERAPGLEA